MNEPRAVAEAVRRACIEAALQAYEDAGLQGLCQEGRWECAIEAIRGLDLRDLVKAPGGEPADRQQPS